MKIEPDIECKRADGSIPHKRLSFSNSVCRRIIDTRAYIHLIHASQPPLHQRRKLVELWESLKRVCEYLRYLEYAEEHPSKFQEAIDAVMHAYT